MPDLCTAPGTLRVEEGPGYSTEVGTSVNCMYAWWMAESESEVEYTETHHCINPCALRICLE